MIDPGRAFGTAPIHDAALRRAPRALRARLAARRRLRLRRALDRRGPPRLSVRSRPSTTIRSRSRRRSRTPRSTASSPGDVLDGETDALPPCRRRRRERAARAGGEDPRSPRRAFAITSGYLTSDHRRRPAGSTSTVSSSTAGRRTGSSVHVGRRRSAAETGCSRSPRQRTIVVPLPDSAGYESLIAHHRITHPHHPAPEDVGPQPAPVHEPAERPGRRQPLQVRARLGETAADALDRRRSGSGGRRERSARSRG